jgi:hypothetical protein
MKRNLTFRIEQELVDALTAAAQRRGHRVSDEIRERLEAPQKRQRCPQCHGAGTVTR